MDPKALSNLDPKLRETYGRVMGAPSSVPSNSPSSDLSMPKAADAAPTTTNNNNNVTASPELTATSPFSATSFSSGSVQTPPSQQPVTPYNPEIAPPQSMAASATPMSEVQPLPSPASVAQAANEKNSTPILKALYIGGAVIFLIVYTIFWIKVFNLPFIF